MGRNVIHKDIQQPGMGREKFNKEYYRLYNQTEQRKEYLKKRSREQVAATRGKQITLRFSLEADGDILEMLEKVDNKTDYIRKLIRDDMKKGQ